LSGRKGADWGLDRRTQLLIDATNELGLAQNKARSLRKRLESLANEIEKITVGDPVVAQRLREYMERLKLEEPRLGARQVDLERIRLPEVSREVDEDILEKTRREISRLDGKNDGVGSLLDEVSSQVINLKTADKSLAKIDVALSRVQAELQMREELLSKWLPEKRGELGKTSEMLSTSRVQYRSALDKGENPDKVAENLKQMEEEIRRLSQGVNEAAKEADRREKLHRERLYVLKALRGTCAYLGFEEVSDPSYGEGNPNNPVAQTFDTVNKGTITFKLYLDGHVESDSGISVDSCGKEFGRVSEILADEYGIQTEFKRIGDDSLPERITSTEKPVPRERKPKHIGGENS
jgi:hypothetical protein